LHHGELRETGTHQELLNLKGLYWRLFQLQYANAPERQINASNGKGKLETNLALGD